MSLPGAAHGRLTGLSPEHCKEIERRIRVSFGAGLYSARTAAGLTQKELAEAVGISRPSIQAMEVGRQNVTLVMVFRLARALRCEPLALWPQ